MQSVSVGTRNRDSEANVDDGERSIFSPWRSHFAPLNLRPTNTEEDTLVDGEEQDSQFTFLAPEQRRENEDAV
jgi:hypothetical protein